MDTYRDQEIITDLLAAAGWDAREMTYPTGRKEWMLVHPHFATIRMTGLHSAAREAMHAMKERAKPKTILL